MQLCKVIRHCPLSGSLLCSPYSFLAISIFVPSHSSYDIPAWKFLPLYRNRCLSESPLTMDQTLWAEIDDFGESLLNVPSGSPRSVEPAPLQCLTKESVDPIEQFPHGYQTCQDSRDISKIRIDSLASFGRHHSMIKPISRRCEQEERIVQELNGVSYNRSLTPASLISTVAPNDINAVDSWTGYPPLVEASNYPLASGTSDDSRSRSFAQTLVDLTNDDEQEHDNESSVSSASSTIILDSSRHAKPAANNNAVTDQDRRAAFELPFREHAVPSRALPRTPTHSPRHISQTSTARVHRWTEDERTLLCVLKRWYQLSWAECEVVFYKCFQEQFRTRDEQPIRAHVLQSQWSCLNRTGSNSEFLAVTRDVPFNDPKGVFRSVRSKIEATAKLVGVELCTLNAEGIRSPLPKPKVTPSPVRLRVGSQAPARLRSRADQDILSQLPYVTDPFGFLIQQRPKSPSLKPPEQAVEGGGGGYTPSPTRPQQRARRSCGPRESGSVASVALDLEGSSAMKVPALLYRFFDELSFGSNSAQSFKAELFKSWPYAVPDPIEGQSMFDFYATNHLWEHETVSMLTHMYLTDL